MRQKAYVFDTFQYVKELTKVGFQPKQAEVQVKLMAELVNQTLCTREDLERSEGRLSYRLYDLDVKVESVKRDLEIKIKDLDVKIESVRRDLEVKLESLKKDLTLQISQAKHEMIKWLIGTSIAGLSVMFTLMKFLL
ncbi:MAG: DUF1640 domain-containing protein [Rickettsiella sp.]|nr:DUF1640 domain-containing protein [Rickettsiella sp.]